MDVTPLLRATGLTRRYPLPRTRLFAPRRYREALRGVDLDVTAGDGGTGIVGESGSGKSTLVRLLLAVDRPDGGTVAHRGRELAGAPAAVLREFRRDVQVVLQDPFASLDPRMRVGAIVAEPLECLDVPGDHRARVHELLAAVGLEKGSVDRYPHQFSGGQRQRIAIARALAPGPRVLVGDEPLSALDVAVRVQVMDLLAGLATDLGLALVLVSHDIGAVARLCRTVVVLHEGAVVERGDTATVLSAPEHEYTQRLLAAVPRLPTT